MTTSTAAPTAAPARPAFRHAGEFLIQSMAVLVLALALASLAPLLIDVVLDGWARLNWQFLTSLPSRRPADAGIYAALIGSIYVMSLTTLLALPLGIGAAVYLEEYGSTAWFNRFIEINIANLAGVPSIVYGILGLAFIVRGIGLGRVLLAGAIILTLLVLPTVIVASREAIRAVPDSIRQGAYALGATQWQVIWRQVLPAAIPGTATGSILALARAIGETAPLLLVGALTFVAVNPTVLGSFTALPVQIYQWIGRPQEEFRLLAAAGIIVLLAILLTMNALAIWLRNRYQRRW